MVLGTGGTRGVKSFWRTRQTGEEGTCLRIYKAEQSFGAVIISSGTNEGKSQCQDTIDNKDVKFVYKVFKRGQNIYKYGPTGLNVSV